MHKCLQQTFGIHNFLTFFETSESDCSDDQVTEDFETAYARAMSEYERDLRLRQVGRIESKSE